MFWFRLLKVGMKHDKFSTLHLTACLSLVNQLIVETQMHSSAHNSGHLRSNHLSLQLRQQQLHANVGRSSSFRNMGSSDRERVEGKKKKQQNMSGSRTSSALVSREHLQTTVLIKSSINDKQKNKKSSVIKNFSNIFKNGLKL